MARSTAAFPLVGLLIGGLGAAAGALALWVWGPPLHLLCVVLAWTLLSGALHLDGLADSCDALFSWQPRERKLEIMKDSRIGTMGALALVLVLLLKLAALHHLGSQWWLGALLAPLWGRWADVYGLFFFPPARQEGLGRAFGAQVRFADFLAATLSALLCSALFTFPGGVLLGLAVWGLTHFLARRMVRSLGGLTGDAYGALCECGEVIALLCLAALQRHLPIEVRLVSLLLDPANIP
jgi:adenosylcobinamide-GDP ribazoletransferase